MMKIPVRHHHSDPTGDDCGPSKPASASTLTRSPRSTWPTSTRWEPTPATARGSSNRSSTANCSCARSGEVASVRSRWVRTTETEEDRTFVVSDVPVREVSPREYRAGERALLAPHTCRS